MSRMSFTRSIARVLIAGLLPLALAGPARASHESIAIDGDLLDLIDAIDNNPGSPNGGFKFNAPVGDVCTVAGCCFVNGFDVQNYYLFLDFKNSAGAATHDDVRLYAGWDVVGKIGDTDGNGDANTYTPDINPCATGEPSSPGGIGAGESYQILIDTDCDNQFNNLIISVQGQFIAGQGVQTRVIRDPLGAAVDITAQCQFAINPTNHQFLELRINNFRQLIEDAVPGADLCHSRIKMTADSQPDGLGEDRGTTFRIDVPPSVKITKLPAEQTVCPNQPVTWTIEVTNTGLCKLQTLAVDDVMDAGLVFDSSVPASTATATGRHWDFTDLASAQSQTITLNAHTDPVWVAPVLNNNASVEGAHTPLLACGEPESANDDATAIVNSQQNTTATALDPQAKCAGQEAQFCTVASGTGPFTYAWTKDNVPILGESEACLTIASVTAGDAGEYCVTVTGACGPATPQCATLTVTSGFTASAISDVTQCPGPGTQAQFCTTTTGSVLSISWTKNGQPLTETSNCLTISPVTAGDAGRYCVTVTGDCGEPIERCADLSTDCPENLCWLTAGGAKIAAPGVRGQPFFSWGGVVYPGCSPLAGAGGNWNLVAHVTSPHFQGIHIEVDDCGNVPGIPPGSGSPQTPNNFIEFHGTGRLFGVAGNPANYPLVYFFSRAEDRAEPGSRGQRDPLFKDRFYMHVWWNQADPVGSTLILINQTSDPNNVQPVLITDGNMQIHFTGCTVTAARVARPLNPEPEDDQASADGLLPPGVPVPNPFRETTRIAYAVAAQAADVEVAVYDLAGRKVRSRVSGRAEPGQYAVTWDGRDDQGASVGHGMYFVRTRVSGQTQIMRRVLLLN